MRWDRLFEDLEAQFEAADRAEFAAEVADRTRREVATVQLLDRLRQAVGVDVELSLDGAGAITGVVRRVGAGWLMLAGPQHDVLVLAPAILSGRRVPVAALAAAANPSVADRLDVGHVLRMIARDRVGVTVLLRDGSRLAGTIDRVGADFLDLAEHLVGEPRRARQVSGLRMVAFAGLAAVRAG